MPRLPPELARPQCWDLQVGIAGRPRWVGLGRATVGALVVLAFAWWLGLFQAWRHGQGVHGAIVLAGALGLVVWASLWVAPTWRQWSGPVRHLTLSWSPTATPDEAPWAPGTLAPTPWRVATDEDPLIPARADVVLDVQRWLLVRLQTVVPDRHGMSQTHWVVLNDDPGDASLHRLRLLLRLNPGSTSIPERHGAVASSRMAVGSSAGSTSQSPMKHVFGRLHGAILRRTSTGTSSARPHRDPVSAFPPTQIDTDRRGP